MDGSRVGSLSQLSGKRRNYDDLSRFVGARAAGAPNYSVLLGAGCSVSSNIRSASQLVREWRQDVISRIGVPADMVEHLKDEQAVIDYLSKNQTAWYNAQKEYSSLFEKNFDLPRQRRMFVEREVASKSPNLGYAYLVRLVEEGYFNTLFTTNFDDLLNESFFQFSQTRPIVCAHDSAINSITVTSKRPKIIKLHGDYLFDDIKATVRETESLEDNTRRKFTEFCRDFGLVVIGYGGGDRSIMDVMQYLLRSEDYFKHGVYWCIRKGEEPSEELTKLLWKDRVYYVEIDGFDELMASLHSDLVGNSLPIDTGVITNKPREIIKGFISNSFLNESRSDVIRRDLERLRKQSEREELFNVLREVKEGGSAKDAGVDETLSEKDLVVIFEIKQHLSAGDFDAARSRVIKELEQKPSRRLKEELADFRVHVEELAGDLGAAIAAVDGLISEDPRESENYVRKTFLTLDHGQRLDILDHALGLDHENPRLLNRRAECLIGCYESGSSVSRDTVLPEIRKSLESSLRYDPSLRNGAWTIASNFYSAGGLSKDRSKEALNWLCEASAPLGKTRLGALRIRLARYSAFKEDRNGSEADALLADIASARLSSSMSNKPYFEWLELDAYSQLGRKDQLSRRLSDLAVDQDLSSSRDYLKRRSDFLIKFNGDLEGATKSMMEAVEAGKRISDVRRAAVLLEYAKDAEGICALAVKNVGRLRHVDMVLLKRAELMARGDVEGALAQLRLLHSKKLVDALDRSDEIHDLLLLNRFSEAEGVAKDFLERVAWEKNQFGAYIVNFEMSVLRQGKGLTKRRLADLVDSSIEGVKGCASFLLGDLNKARDTFVSMIREDREMAYVLEGWAIFKDQKGAEFINDVKRRSGAG